MSFRVLNLKPDDLIAAQKAVMEFRGKYAAYDPVQAGHFKLNIDDRERVPLALENALPLQEWQFIFDEMNKIYGQSLKEYRKIRIKYKQQAQQQQAMVICCVILCCALILAAAVVAGSAGASGPGCNCQGDCGGDNDGAMNKELDKLNQNTVSQLAVLVMNLNTRLRQYKVEVNFTTRDQQGFMIKNYFMGATPLNMTQVSATTVTAMPIATTVIATNVTAVPVATMTRLPEATAQSIEPSAPNLKEPSEGFDPSNV